MDIETERELREFKKEQDAFALELKKEQDKMSRLLHGEMGKDIKEVINGNKIVKLSFREKLKYKVNFILNKIFDTF
jgi:hypothetical protein